MSALISPSTTGTLQASPLYRLLISTLERRLSGSFVFEAQDGSKSALLVREGAATKIKLARAVVPLGALCVEKGFFTQTQLDSALPRPRKGHFGESLVELGLLHVQQLEEALSEQFTRNIERLASLPASTIFGFYEGQDFLARWGGPLVAPDPLALLWRVVRASDLSPALLKAALAPLGGNPLRLHAEARVSRFGFDAKERSIVDLIRLKPYTLDELLGLGVVPRASAERVLAALVLTRHLEGVAEGGPIGVESTPSIPVQERVHDRQSRPSQSGSQLVAVRPEEPAKPAADRAQFEAEAQQLLEADYYVVLGVARETPVSSVQAAFLRLAKRWHPDRLDQSWLDLRPLVSRVFARITEAHSTLSNPARRQEYDALLADDSVGPDERDEVQRVLNAANAFQRAQVLVKRAEWEEALNLALEAQRNDPDQAEYAALAAWLEARKLHGAALEVYAPLLDRLARAEKKQPNNLRVRMYRADVLKAAGKLNEAIKEYRFIAEADPSNVEAQRELRLFKMRSGTPTSDAPGLFGRFFKKG
ncbi:MAG TPA: DnaJ domain-containing protein [Polyangiaceae bacterium]|nr:DnaJ domain-containing protein [Polyangiaceae bacterium]